MSFALLIRMMWPSDGVNDPPFGGLIFVTLAPGLVVGLGVGLPSAAAVWGLRSFQPWARELGVVAGALLLFAAPPLGIVVLIGLMNQDVRRAFQG